MSNAHTPTPWFANLEGLGSRSSITAHEDVTVCEISVQDPQCDGSRSFEAEHANAELIVRAVNAYEHLLATLKEIANEQSPGEMGDYGRGEDSVIERHAEMARAALLKAEGRS